MSMLCPLLFVGLLIGVVVAVSLVVLHKQQLVPSRTRLANPSGCAPVAVPVPGRGSVVYYRTRDGRADYGFSFEEHSGNFRVYIVSQPSYGTRDASAHATHRLTDGQRHYVCWAGTLRTLAEARQVAALWADNTQEYIRSGKQF